MAAVEPATNRSRTKIVATVGPACRSPEMLRELLGAGVDVFRLNMAHGNLAEHEQTLQEIRAAEIDACRPVGVLVDLAGPKIRLGEITPDPLPCGRHEQFQFVRELSGAAHELTCNYPRLIDELSVNDRVLLADGTVEMIVTEVNAERAVCRVIGPGMIRSRQGINLPGAKLSVPAMSDDDIEHAQWAGRNEVDFISLSFVRSPDDIQLLRRVLAPLRSPAQVVAKIEKPEALDQLDAIVQAADGIMVARGDLGVEIDVAEMPVKQKWIIDTCQRWKKPVIVATQMLDSMQRASRPTRAEATDVANAIFDGADACMLSGETAVGSYPIESVQMMNRIMLSTESALEHTRYRRDSDLGSVDPVHPITSAIIQGAGQIARKLSARMVVIATRSGRTALTKAKQRDFISTVAVSDRLTTLRQMSLYWGITPLAGVPHDLDRDLVAFIDQWGREQGVLHTRDFVVFVAGTKVNVGAHNQLWVHQVS